MLAVQDQSQVIGEFIDWLSSKGMTICSTTGGSEAPCSIR